MRLQSRFVSDIYSAVLELAVPLFLLVFLIFGIGFLLHRASVGKTTERVAPFLLAFTFLGAVPGVIAGSSQEPIVGAMLTGLLGIVSSLLAYLFSREALSQWRPTIPFAMILMVVSALGGLTIGSIRKAKFDNFDREFAIYKSELENLYFPVEREHRLMRLRQEYQATEQAAGASAP